MTSIESKFKSHQTFYEQGNTHSYAFRKAALKSMYKAIKNNEDALTKALHDDLHKPPMEAYMSEIGFIYHDIKHQLKNLREWMQPEKNFSPLVLFPSHSYVYHQPQGVVLILGPWNYPFNLLMAPLAAAVAAGNCVMVKTSSQTPQTAAITKKIIQEAFDQQHVSVVEISGREVIPKLIEPHPFNHIFFTGSKPVGQLIMKAAAEHLSQVTLELGGKSPCIVDKTANIQVAAKRIGWAKCFNAGQTCVAPDYLIVHADVKEQLITELKKFFNSLGDSHTTAKDFGRIINAKRFEAVRELIQPEKVIFGGNTDADNLYIQPTLMDGVTLNDPVMQEEIFGPILPIISFQSIEEVYSIVARNPYPLALYVFTKSKKMEKDIIQNIPFGGGGVNSAIMHLSDPDLPFGGIQYSGLGNYHGKSGFETFSHQKSILKTGTWFDLPIKYPPYKTKYLSWIKKAFRITE